MNVVISQEMLDMLKSVKKDNQSLNEVVEQALKLGCYQLEYRRGPEAVKTRKVYQAKRREEDKKAREFYKIAQKDPDLAVKVGLGTRPIL